MLGLIIYGTRSISSIAGSGQFACPRCSMMRAYDHRHMRAYFTLYFIPLIPLWKNGEYVECRSCGGTYGVEVLSLTMEELGMQAQSSGNLSMDSSRGRTPALEDPRTALAANIRRTLVLFIAALGKATPPVMEAFREGYHEMTYTDLLDEQIRQDYEQAKAAGATMATFVPRQLGTQSPELKQNLLNVAARIAAAEGMITSTGREALLQLGQALGLDGSLVQTTIQNRGR